MIPSQPVPAGENAQTGGASSLFADAAGAARWLVGQPQANAAAMLAALIEQIEAFNARDVAPGERYAVLEALRMSVVAVASENRKRYEFRALPLLPAEYSLFLHVERLWRACALGYQRCLRAAVEGDASGVARAAELAQRTLSCLRMEQVNGYVAGGELADDFWPLLHAAWACAERLGCTRQAVIDRVLKETHESTPSGHYGMAMLLHLARPYALSRAEFAATYRWFMRWRELAGVESAPSVDCASLASAPGEQPTQPISDAAASPAITRWFSSRGVLRKIRQRVELLAAGQSPESLNLGSSLSARECMTLLKTLDYRLNHAQAPSMDGTEGDMVVVAVGIGNCHRQLGGAMPETGPAPTSSFASQLVAQQIAVFGHAVRAPDRSSERAGELWRLVAQDAGQLQLVRTPGGGDARIALRSLLMVRLPQRDDDLLATVSSLCVGRDGSLRIAARRLNGRPVPILAEVRDHHAAKGERHTAIVLAAPNGIGAPQLFIAAGLSPRTTPIRFFDIDGSAIPALRVDECLDQGRDCERWTIAV